MRRRSWHHWTLVGIIVLSTILRLNNIIVSQPEGGCFEVKSIARPSVVFAESAPDNLMPSARAAPTPRAYSMALQTLPTSLKKTNKVEDSLSDERCGSGASSRYQAWQSSPLFFSA